MVFILDKGFYSLAINSEMKVIVKQAWDNIRPARGRQQPVKRYLWRF